MDSILRSFINRLESLPDKSSLDILKKCVMETDGRQLPIEEYISFSDQEYKRNFVHVSSKCEVTVLCFKKGQITPIHDHGGSIGVQNRFSAGYLGHGIRIFCGHFILCNYPGIGAINGIKLLSDHMCDVWSGKRQTSEQGILYNINFYFYRAHSAWVQYRSVVMRGWR